MFPVTGAGGLVQFYSVQNKNKNPDGSTCLLPNMEYSKSVLPRKACIPIGSGLAPGIGLPFSSLDTDFSVRHTWKSTARFQELQAPKESWSFAFISLGWDLEHVTCNYL